MQLKIHISLFCCIFLFYAQSQNNDTLRTVEVLSKKDSILKLTVINSSVPHYILNKDKLNELSAKDVGDAIKYIPGTYIKDYGGIGGVKTVSYRSLGAGHTNVEVDGVILPNTQTAAINLSQFDIFSINRLEMSSGQVQNHYSTASSYVKSNLISIYSSLFDLPAKKINLKLMGNASSINTYQGGLFYQQKFSDYFSFGIQSLYQFGSGKYDFTIKNVDSTYTSERQDSQLEILKLKGGFSYQRDKLKIHLNSSYSDNKQKLPGAVVLYNPYNDQSLKNKILNSTLTGHYKSKKIAIGTNFFIQANQTVYRDDQYLNSQGYLENRYNNEAYGGGFIFNRFLKFESQKIFIGSDFKQAKLMGDQFQDSPIRTNINSVIGLSKWLWRIKLQANLSHQYIYDKTPNGNREISHFSPFISLAHIPFQKHNFRIRSHYKNTYRLPSFNDLYYNSIGNSNLKAENAKSFNIGLTYAKSIKLITFETTLDIYQNKIKDKIVAIPTKNLFNWSMQNIGDVLSQGIDLSILYSYTKASVSIVFSTSQSYNTSIDVTKSTNFTYGHQIPYTPNYTASYTSTLGYKKYALSFTLIQTGSRYVINENLPFNQLDGFIDLGIGISRTFKLKRQTLYCKLNVVNLLNNNYEVIRSFPMPGRHFNLKIVYKFNT
jgi:outer membrane cobalamin receptor